MGVGGSNQGASVFGALPQGYPVPPPSEPQSPPGYDFINWEPTILRCMVIAPYSMQAFHIVTDEKNPGYTTFKDSSQRVVASIEWIGQKPKVEIPGFVSKKEVRQWIAPAPAPNRQIYRQMTLQGRQYSWIMRGDQICLFLAETPLSDPLAIITKYGVAARLQICQPQYTQLLLLPCIVATVLLLCGRRLD